MEANSTLETTTVVYPQTAVTFALVFCVVFIVVGFCGNLLTVLAILAHRKLRASPTSIFIVSLSFTDLIFCCFNLPITAVRFAHQKWILGLALCKLFPFFFYVNVAASLFNMMAVTINRYVLIAHYTKYDKIYRRWCVGLMIGACWVVPLALLSPTLAGVWGRFGYAPHTFSCTILPDLDGKSPKKFLFLLGFFLPCIIIIGCYACILYVVKKSRRTMASHSDVKSRSSSDENMTLTRMVLVIFVSFLLCYLPLMLVNVFDNSHTFPAIHVMASILAWAASVINPWIYGVMSARYRQAYTGLLPCWKKKLQISGTTSSGARGSTTALFHTSVRYGDSLVTPVAANTNT